jgi:hypothetical protein
MEVVVRHPFFQVGVLVKDIESARAELAASLGLDWSEVVTRDVGEWTIRVCFARQGPPYLELIEGPVGSPWDCGETSRIDHIGLWTDSLEEAKQAVMQDGLALEMDGSSLGGKFTYHRGVHSGLRVELLDASGREAFYERWGLAPPAE